jgi:hypothetical protein
MDNEIFHVTVNGAGDVWLTQTQTGSISFVPFNASQPSYSGHIASWFGGSLNKNNSVIHDTSNARLRGSDGSTVALHMVDHTSFSARGIVTPSRSADSPAAECPSKAAIGYDASCRRVGLNPNRRDAPARATHAVAPSCS